jgi:hypothetical protein
MTAAFNNMNYEIRFDIFSRNLLCMEECLLEDKKLSKKSSKIPYFWAWADKLG